MSNADPTPPSDRPLMPLVAVAGPPGSGGEMIAEALAAMGLHLVGGTSRLRHRRDAGTAGPNSVADRLSRWATNCSGCSRVPGGPLPSWRATGCTCRKSPPRSARGLASVEDLLDAGSRRLGQHRGRRLVRRPPRHAAARLARIPPRRPGRGDHLAASRRHRGRARPRRDLLHSCPGAVGGTTGGRPGRGHRPAGPGGGRGPGGGGSEEVDGLGGILPRGPGPGVAHRRRRTGHRGVGGVPGIDGLRRRTGGARPRKPPWPRS